LACHVWQDLAGRVPFILDGGPTQYGLESTVVDCSQGAPRLLRPGAVTLEMCEAVCGPLEVVTSAEKPAAPGMKYTHYAPRAPLTLVLGPQAPQVIRALVARAGPGAGVLATAQSAPGYDPRACLVLVAGASPEAAGANLFALLREFDAQGVTEIFAEGIPEQGAGLAVMNRLRKAAAKILQTDSQLS
jgi:L-threonylcarbamoyladenylate synthase